MRHLFSSFVFHYIMWPNPDTPDLSPIAKEGITWHELAVAFVVDTRSTISDMD